ncbi:AtpZ/AtpI family protein [Desulfatirhabdium butyrativorans]|uniref:AtpZ/AtpI family protein n=1 Tax=Desulfatirhabdium butyrativorans TaxID=340467 RepID=UPI001FDFCCF5|nr:AtpZ/AtpI family protein [Desulfatirhabdium butyrativorans]
MKQVPLKTTAFSAIDTETDSTPKPYRWLRFRTSRMWSEHLSFIMQIGLTMAGCIVFCFFLGRYIDGILHLRGIFVSLSTVFGVVGGAFTTYRQIIEMTDRDKRIHPPADRIP